MLMGAHQVERLLAGRRFGPRTVQALRLIAWGVPQREATATVGLKSHQDVARLASEIGVGRRLTGANERARPRVADAAWRQSRPAFRLEQDRSYHRVSCLVNRLAPAEDLVSAGIRGVPSVADLTNLPLDHPGRGGRKGRGSL